MTEDHQPDLLIIISRGRGGNNFISKLLPIREGCIGGISLEEVTRLTIKPTKPQVLQQLVDEARRVATTTHMKHKPIAYYLPAHVELN